MKITPLEAVVPEAAQTLNGQAGMRLPGLAVDGDVQHVAILAANVGDCRAAGTAAGSQDQLQAHAENGGTLGVGTPAGMTDPLRDRLYREIS